jgi:hypothetical protein
MEEVAQRIRLADEQDGRQGEPDHGGAGSSRRDLDRPGEMRMHGPDSARSIGRLSRSALDATDHDHLVTRGDGQQSRRVVVPVRPQPRAAQPGDGRPRMAQLLVGDGRRHAIAGRVDASSCHHAQRTVEPEPSQRGFEPDLVASPVHGRDLSLAAAGVQRAGDAAADRAAESTAQHAVLLADAIEGGELAARGPCSEEVAKQPDQAQHHHHETGQCELPDQRAVDDEERQIVRRWFDRHPTGGGLPFDVASFRHRPARVDSRVAPLAAAEELEVSPGDP